MSFIEPAPNMTVAQPSSDKRKWGMLVVLSLALAIIILDSTILNVALSAIIRDLKTDIQSVQWVITAYSLILAALTITGGRLGDIFGRKRMFVFGAVLFAIGSFIASVSQNVPTLIIGESIIEGIGAALMMPATASLLVANFKGRERAVAFGVWGGIAGAAAALGPILGGYLTTHYNWRWGFRVNLFVVLALLVGSFIIPESQDREERPELDWTGVLLSASGLFALVFGIIEASRYGWWTAKEVFTLRGHEFVMPGDLSIVPFCIAIGLVILTLFILWERSHERRGHTPLVSVKLFNNRMFTTGVLTTTVMSLGQTGLIFALPVFLQAVRGLDAFHTGLALLPMPLALLVIAPASATIGKKISPKILVSVGLLVNVLAYIVLRQSLNVDTTEAQLIPGLALFGIGMGLVMSQINNMTLSAVSVEQAGEASGVNNTFRQLGATLGSAIIGTILVGSLGTNLTKGIQASTVIPDQLKTAMAQAVSSQTSNVEFGGGARIGQGVSEAIRNEIVSISHKATVDANRKSLAYGAGFAVLGFLVSFLLPSAKKENEHTPIRPVATASVPVTAIKEEEGGALDTDLIADLIVADRRLRDQGGVGFGPKVRAILLGSADDHASNAQAPLPIGQDSPRVMQARVLWEKGWGRALGMKNFDAYLATIPEITSALLAHDSNFPHLVLVDRRVSIWNAARAIGVTPVGNATTATMPALHQTDGVYWMRCQDGERFTGWSMASAEQSGGVTEKALDAAEGVALLAQDASLPHRRYVDLPGTPHTGWDRNGACLGLWNGRLELRWRRKDLSDPRCGTATKRLS